MKLRPPIASRLTFAMLAGFDDRALSTFLDPSDGGLDASLLGRACHGVAQALVWRIRDSLPPDAQPRFDQGLHVIREQEDAAAARQEVVERLAWPLIYWHHAAEYDELASAEQVHPAVLAEMDLGGRVVCDIGAGSGRFSLHAVTQAEHVISVDAVPALLGVLERKATAARVRNLTIHRGSFASLPLDDASVDVAVACSAFQTRGPHGGERPLCEAERVVRPGGRVIVVWPQEPGWFEERGFAYRRFEGNEVMRFRDAESAARLCGRFCSADAEAWVRRHAASEVPYSVLGTKPPNDVCVKCVTA